MVFPSVATKGTTYNTGGAGALSHDIDLPDGLEIGRRVFVLATKRGTGGFTWPVSPEWTQVPLEGGGVLSVQIPNNNGRIDCRYRDIDGTEGWSDGSFITLTIDSELKVTAFPWAVTDYDPATPPVAAIATGSGTTTADPPSLNPSDWDIEDTLWIAWHGRGISGATSIYPLTDNQEDAVAGGTSPIASSICSTDSATASLDPGTFTFAANANWAAATIAVRPAPPPPPPPPPPPSLPTVGGTAPVSFVHGSAVAPSDVVLEWDFDNDGDFDEPEENVTGDMVATETSTGRDFPSQLTGKATPGKLKTLLRNDDNRFSIFNANSPLEQDGRSLDAGRKLRVRVAEAANPDPELLAIDRFRRAPGPLVGTNLESGQAWETVTGFTDFTVVDNLAQATSLGNEHINVFDVGVADYFLQAQIGRILIGSQTPDTSVGVVYRFVDNDDYSLLRIRAVDSVVRRLEVVDVVAGTPTATTIGTVTPFDGRVIGIHAHGTVADIYLEGVDLETQVPAGNLSATKAGIYGDWLLHVPPEIANVRVWDRVTARTDGIIWTGDVDDVITDSKLGPDKTADLTGSGVLARLSTQQIQFPGVTGNSQLSAGIGRVLSEAKLLSPPGQLSQSNLSGRFALDEADAIEVARRIEETELGFLYESQEGWVNFDRRDQRVGATPQAVFSDREGDQFGYRDIRPLSWRREIFNQVDAVVSPRAPDLIVGIAHQATFPGVEFNVGALAPVTPGDLLLGWAICGGFATVDWHGSLGWVELTTGKPQNITGADGDNFRLFARVADGTESGFVRVATCGANVEFVTDLVAIRNWWGDIRQGIEMAEPTLGNQPPSLSIPWAPEPTTLFVLRVGMLGDSTVEGWTEQGFDGYLFGQQILRSTASANMCMQRAHKGVAALETEEPAAFDGTFASFGFVVSSTFAVRGFNGTPPGENTKRVEDLESQDRHNAVKSYVNPGDLFVDDNDATEYGELVLARFGGRRPVVEIEWQAHKNAAYRNQALRRRVGDMIYLRADGPTGLGIAGRFFIENVGNRFEKDGTIWVVTWQLSPA